MSKNIVVCCDGTGNQFSEKNSNVVKLYACLQENAGQVNYYHPGVGTMGSPNSRSWIGRQATKIAGLAFGYGFRANIADAYRFLMENYVDGDRIFLFGFSRGAYTVRAIAGALSMYGLLCPGNEGHLPYLLRMYSKASRKAYKRPRNSGRRLPSDPMADAFRQTFSRVVPIHFIGVWDTVSSIGWIYDPVKLLFDGENPIMRKGRHAVSVDEHRCFFQNYMWGPPLKRSETPILERNYPVPVCRQHEFLKEQLQDIVQAWFAGVHSDVGGSYKQSECSPAMDAFKWILEEAKLDLLSINEDKRSAIIGDPTAQAQKDYGALIDLNQPPAPGEKLHKSLTWKWRPLEWFPHKYFDAKGELRWRIAPVSHRREIPDDALFHKSLRDRLNLDTLYKPANIENPKKNIHGITVGMLADVQPAAEQRLIEQGFGIYRPKVFSPQWLAQEQGQANEPVLTR